MTVTSPGSSARTLSDAVREAEILRSGALFVGTDDRLTAIVERARVRFGTAMAALTIIHGEWQHVIAGVGVTPGTYRLSASFCAHAIQAPDRVLCIPDATQDDRVRHIANVIGGDRLRFYAGAPLISGGQALGALCVYDSVARPCFDPADEAALRAMAAEAMATIVAVAREAPDTPSESV